MEKTELNQIKTNPNFNFYTLDNAMYLDHKNGKTLIRKEINNFGKSDFLECEFYDHGVLAIITTSHEDYTGTFENPTMLLSKKIIFINNAGKKVFEQEIDAKDVEWSKIDEIIAELKYSERHKEIITKYIVKHAKAQTDIGNLIDSLASLSHQDWIALQTSKIANHNASLFWGAFNKYDLKIINGENVQGEHSDIFKMIMGKTARERLKDKNLTNDELFDYDEVLKISIDKIKKIDCYNKMLDYESLPVDEKLNIKKLILNVLTYCKENNIGNEEWIEKQYKVVEENIKEDLFNNLLNNLAGVLHYESWYKESIEGKFGLETDGADNGRFRKSKDIELDKEFIENLEFDENGYSVLKSPEGYPFYKMEDGVFYVDSAIKTENFDFLPPSWKAENIKAAEVVVNEINNCYESNFNISNWIELISNIIHKNWVARQVIDKIKYQNEEEMSEDDKLQFCTYVVKTLNKYDLDILADKPAQGEHSRLFEELGGAERIKEIWGYQNLASFDLLPFEEQIKDTNQILYVLKYLKENNIGNKEWIEKQYNEVKEKIEEIKKNQSYKTEKGIEDNN